jgi:hypothetical protein
MAMPRGGTEGKQDELAAAAAAAEATKQAWDPNKHWQMLPKHVIVAGQLLCFHMYFKEPVPESTVENHR